MAGAWLSVWLPGNIYSVSTRLKKLCWDLMDGTDLLLVHFYTREMSKEKLAKSYCSLPGAATEVSVKGQREGGSGRLRGARLTPQTSPSPVGC